MSEIKSVHAVIRGRVQGVSYRAWTQGRAERLGLAGWVRNRDDGVVEVVVTGPAEAVDALLAACRSGPPAARVEGITVEPAEPVTGSGFRVTE